MKNIYFLVIGLSFISIQLKGQSITNVKATLDGNNVIISYDLKAAVKGQKFDVIIKSSKDGFVNALSKVTGDLGSGQIAGTGKKIIWEAKEELGVYKGVVSFEITATVIFTPIQFLQPIADTQVKIGKPYTLEWKGGTLDRNLKLELLKNNNQVMEMGTINNTGSYTWNVPKTMQKGDNYQFKLSDASQPNDAIVSIGFNLQKKKSALVFVIPIALVGVGAAVLLGGGDDGGGTIPPVETTTVPDLPTDLLNPGGG